MLSPGFYPGERMSSCQSSFVPPSPQRPGPCRCSPPVRPATAAANERLRRKSMDIWPSVPAKSSTTKTKRKSLRTPERRRCTSSLRVYMCKNSLTALAKGRRLIVHAWNPVESLTRSDRSTPSRQFGQYYGHDDFVDFELTSSIMRAT